MRNFKRIQTKLFVLGCGILFASCLTNVDEVEELDPCDAITFSVDVKPIIDNNCIQCHGTGGNFPNLTTYTGVSSNAARVKSEVVSKRMPIGSSLTDAEIQAISCWVDSGALDN